jgi:hypothetical protein
MSIIIRVGINLDKQITNFLIIRTFLPLLLHSIQGVLLVRRPLPAGSDSQPPPVILPMTTFAKCFYGVQHNQLGARLGHWLMTLAKYFPYQEPKPEVSLIA